MNRRILSGQCLLFTAALGICAVGGLHASALAQEQPQLQPPTREIEAPEATVNLTQEAVQARITQIESATDLAEGTKAELLSLYRQALDQLAVAANWEARVAEFTKGRQEAATDLEQAKQRLAEVSARATQPTAPDIPPDATLEYLTQELSKAEADLQARQEATKKLEDEAKYRAERRVAIPGLLADANKRLEKITKDLSTPPGAAQAAQLAQARRTLLLVQKRAVEQEIRAYDQELQFYNARSEVLATRRDAARLAVAEGQARTAAWQAKVSERRQAEVERQKKQADEELRRASPAVRDLAETNAKLAEERAALAGKLDALRTKFQSIKERREELTKDFTFLQENIQSPAMSEVISPVIRRHRNELRDLRRLELDLRALRTEIARVQLRLLDIEEQRLDLLNVDKRVTAILDSLKELPGQLSRERIEPRVRELLTTQRDALERLKKDYETYSDDLTQLSKAESALLAKVDEFEAFVDRHVLWIPSASPIYATRFPSEWRTWPSLWNALGRAVLGEIWSHGPGYLGALLLLLVFVAVRPRLFSDLERTGRKVARPLTDRYALTLQAFACTLILSAPVPLFLALAAWRISASGDVTDPAVYELAQALGAGLRATAMVLFGLELLRHVLSQDGLAPVHFGWGDAAVKLSRTNVRWLSLVGPPIALIVTATERYPDSVWRDSLGRVAFLVGICALAVCAHRLIRPRRGLGASLPRSGPAGAVYNLRYVWYGIGVGVPVLLAAASAWGYHYTAVVLAQRLLTTLALILGLLIGHALLVRWLLVAQRRLKIEQARRRRAAASEARPETAPSSAELPLDEAGLDVVGIADQTRRLLRTVAVVGLAIGVWGIWADIVPALSFLQDVKLWSYTVATVGTTAGGVGNGPTATHVEHVTLAHLLLALIVTISTFVLARHTPGLLEIAILQRLPLDAGGRFAVTAIARYIIVAVGIVLAFGEIGVGWSKVQWIVAAMTVGLGFGLQEIFANFVSGLIILLERPIRIGDVVSVGEVDGKVTQIRMRATTVTDWDRRELLLPNKEFITGRVINWTLSDPVTRVIIPVGIAYGSDTERARDLLLRSADESPLVLKDPAPSAIFREFGDSALNFELRVYIATRDVWPDLMHTLHTAIDQAFRRAGIEIAFPQRDIHVRSIRDALPILGDRRNAAETEKVLGQPG